jgi:hypothetical protein
VVLPRVRVPNDDLQHAMPGSRHLQGKDDDDQR